MWGRLSLRRGPGHHGSLVHHFVINNPTTCRAMGMEGKTELNPLVVEPKGLHIANLTISKDLVLSYIYGDANAKKNHAEADKFCQSLNSTMSVTGKEYVSAHLVSIHGPHFVEVCMDFVYWTGGKVTKFTHDNRIHLFMNYSNFYIIRGDGYNDHYYKPKVQVMMHEHSHTHYYKPNQHEMEKQDQED